MGNGLVAATLEKRYTFLTLKELIIFMVKLTHGNHVPNFQVGYSQAHHRRLIQLLHLLLLRRECCGQLGEYLHLLRAPEPSCHARLLLSFLIIPAKKKKHVKIYFFQHYYCVNVNNLLRPNRAILFKIVSTKSLGQ